MSVFPGVSSCSPPFPFFLSHSSQIAVFLVYITKAQRSHWPHQHILWMYEHTSDCPARLRTSLGHCGVNTRVEGYETGAVRTNPRADLTSPHPVPVPLLDRNRALLCDGFFTKCRDMAVSSGSLLGVSEWSWSPRECELQSWPAALEWVHGQGQPKQSWAGCEGEWSSPPQGTYSLDSGFKGLAQPFKSALYSILRLNSKLI